MSDWIALDWGTSNLRAWLVSENGEIREHVNSDKGMGQLAPAEFEPVLISLIDHWLSENLVTQVMACGMVGARQGWIEAPYSTLPSNLGAVSSVQAPVSDPRIAVTVLSGLSQSRPSSNVMRGEETQIVGYLNACPEFNGVLCLPGTHTKWVYVRNGEIVSFETCMTGELYSLISNHSVLRHSLGDNIWDDEAFKTALLECLKRPETLGINLFEIRAADLLQSKPSHEAKSTLSGMLIGFELASSKNYWFDQHVVLIGDKGLSNLYQVGLNSQGITTSCEDATAMTLEGLCAAYQYHTRIADEA